MTASSTLRSLWRAVKPCPETLALLAIAVPLALAFDHAGLGAEYLAVLVALLVGLHAALRERLPNLGDE